MEIMTQYLKIMRNFLKIMIWYLKASRYFEIPVHYFEILKAFTHRTLIYSIYFFKLLFLPWVFSHRMRILRKSNVIIFRNKFGFSKFSHREWRHQPIVLCGTDGASQQADLLIVCVSHHTVLNDKGYTRATKEENYSRRLSHCCFGHHMDVFYSFL